MPLRLLQPIPDDMETNNEVLVTDELGQMADNPKELDGQTTIPSADP